MKGFLCLSLESAYDEARKLLNQRFGIIPCMLPKRTKLECGTGRKSMMGIVVDYRTSRISLFVVRKP